MFSSPCQKCNGTGRLTWTQVDAGMCWACQGTGSFETKTDPSKLADRRAKARAAKSADTAARVAAGQALATEREARYAADPRIGPETRARCEAHPAYAFETYRVMARIDANDDPRFNTAQALRNISM